MKRTCLAMSPGKSGHTLAGVAIHTIEARPTVLARITVALLSICKKKHENGSLSEGQSPAQYHREI